MKIYIIAGEVSGDARGAELMRAIHERVPAVEFHGLGGPQMQAIAGNISNWTDRAGVIGIIDVVKNYGFFRERFDLALEEVKVKQPDAVILIDYPGFNLRFAKALRQARPKQRIFYYISPQVWAWHRGRIPKMARMLDLMLCIFPFEKPLYEQSGLKTHFVGHPMVETLGATLESAPPREGNLVGLFPGSRKREVKKIFPVMLDAARIMQRSKPDLVFEASASSDDMGERMHSILNQYPGFRCEIVVKNAHDLMRRATVGMICSGTATLEASFLQLPYVVLYKAAWLTFFLGRKLVKVPFLGMVNLLGGKEIVSEFLQEEAQPEKIAAELLRLVNDEEARKGLIQSVNHVLKQLGEPGASRRAADAVLEELSK